ncbi:hypothetical protein COCSADRAFT_87586, partial [Bipolaris sorokiniana ND90Pr]
ELINNVLRLYLDIFIIAYLDNILIYLENKKDYILYIKTVLKELDKYSFRLKLKKYKFYKNKLNFLGYTIGVNRV